MKLEDLEFLEERGNFIKALEQKPEWSGKDAGILQTYVNCLLFEMELKGSAGAGVSVLESTWAKDEAKHLEWLQSDIDNPEWAVLQYYRDMISWIRTQYHFMQAQYQQAQLQCNALIAETDSLILSEKLTRIVQDMPKADKNRKAIEKTIRPASLAFYAGKSKLAGIAKERVERANGLLLSSYYFCIAYNKALQLLAEVLEVPEIDVYATSLDTIEDLITQYNGNLEELESLLEGDTGTQKKKDIVTGYFYPIEYSVLKIPAENTEAARRLIVDKKAFAQYGEDKVLDDDLLRTLMFFSQKRGDRRK